MSTSVVELLVLEGEDAGRLFTLGQDEVDVGRVDPRKSQPGAILLVDRTVSLQQAKIRHEDGELLLEHHPRATNPTTLNGKPVIREPIEVGDRIGMGRVVFEVRSREASQFTTTLAAIGDTGARHPSVELTRQQAAVEDPTEARPVPTAIAQLTVLAGAREQAVFPILAAPITIGRSSECDVTISEGGVSRLHAEIRLEGGRMVIEHKSKTNATSVNGVAIVEPVALAGGDHIQLADRVLLRFDQRTSQSGRIAESSLWSHMEAEIERSQRIEKQFGAFGSFLDIDVVGSFSMKAEAVTPGHIVVSFERWRAWVVETLGRYDGDVLNSNGDELMCFFELPVQSVRAASRLLVDLAAFNAEQNLLASPFRMRMGVHTGRCLVDRTRGVAYSQVLDIAGHLQKAAETNGLLISQATLDHLPSGLPFAAAGEVDGVRTFALSEPLVDSAGS